MSRSRKTLAVPVAALLVPLLAPGLARAGSLKGQVIMPPPPVGEHAVTPPPLAYWRVDNGVVPPTPAPEAHGPVVLVLEPMKVPAGEPAQVMLEARPLRVEPRVVVAQKNATVTIKNGDKVPRTFFLRRGETFLPREQTPPGGVRERKFPETGVFEIGDADYPHGGARLLVVDTPYFTTADGKNEFAFEVPDGKYILKAWWRGAWNDGQAVDVGKSREVVVKLPEKPAQPATNGGKTGENK